ncbi:MAG TPA: choice-of-anchor P family protein [Sporichthyaceae bacterium]
MSGPRAVRVAGAAILVAVGAVGAVGVMPGSARAAGSYEAGAAVDGLRLTISSAQFPVASDFLDVTAPKAQVSSSSQDHQAFASYPYPGDLASAAPGLIAGLAADQGHPLPFAVPGYPLVAAVRCSGDTQTAKVPDTEAAGLPGSLPYTMTSTCTPHGAEAHASSGSSSTQGGVGLTVAHITADAHSGQSSTGVTTATGNSEATGINVGGGLLQLSGLLSTATATVSPSGAFTPASSFTIGTMSVAGTAVDFGPSGLSFPQGSNTPVDVSALNTVLKNAGIELTYLAENHTKTSVTSAGLQITATQHDPQSGVPVVTRYLFGQATANASEQNFTDGVAAPPVLSPPGAVAPTGPVDLSSAAVPPALTDNAAPAVAPATVNLMTPQASQVAQRTVASGSVLSFYLILVLTGAALLASSGLVVQLKKVVPWIR